MVARSAFLDAHRPPPAFSAARGGPCRKPGNSAKRIRIPRDPDGTLGHGLRLLLGAVDHDNITVPHSRTRIAKLLGTSVDSAGRWLRRGLELDLVEVDADGLVVRGPQWSSLRLDEEADKGVRWDALPAVLLRRRGCASTKVGAAVWFAEALRRRRGVPWLMELTERAGLRDTRAMLRAGRWLEEQGLGELADKLVSTQTRTVKTYRMTAHDAVVTAFPGREAMVSEADLAARRRAGTHAKTQSRTHAKTRATITTPTERFPTHKASPRERGSGDGRVSTPKRGDGLPIQPVEFADRSAVLGLLADVEAKATGKTTRAERDAARAQIPQEMRAWLADRAGVERFLSNGAAPRDQVERILEAAGYYDQNPKKRRRAAGQLADAHGEDAAARLLTVVGDVLRDPAVENVGAVLARRRLPRLLSSDPTTALSQNGPKSLAEVFERFRPDKPTEGVGAATAQKALELYRDGHGIKFIADRLGIRREAAKDAINRKLAAGTRLAATA